ISMGPLVNMIGLLLAIALAVASAADSPDQYTWNLSFMGMPVGQHVLGVTYERTDNGLERVLRSTTTVDATPVEFPFQFQMMLAGRAVNDPAAFNASVNRNGTVWGNEV